MATSIKDLPRDEVVMKGHGACAGCPSTLALRIAGKAFGPNAVCVMTPSCTVASLGLIPKAAYDYPILNVCFATAGSSASGIVYAYESLYKKGKLTGEMPTVFTWIGDGGTYDIGLQAISAAAERNDNYIFICYNNEAYSNTGVQRSGATPKFAATTTTPQGKMEDKKNMPLLMLDHQIPYLATASLAYPTDFYDKLVKAKNTRGFKYIEVFAPCCTGWKFPSSDMIRISRMAVTSGAWLLYEAENGKIKFNGPTAKIMEGKVELSPLEDYFSCQGRFASINRAANKEEIIAEAKNKILADIEFMKKRAAF